VCCAFRKSRMFTSMFCCFGAGHKQSGGGGKSLRSAADGGGYTALPSSSQFATPNAFPRAQLNNGFDHIPAAAVIQNGGFPKKISSTNTNTTTLPTTATLTRNGFGTAAVSYGTTAPSTSSTTVAAFL
jgi:hypothetical protein